MHSYADDDTIAQLQRQSKARFVLHEEYTLENYAGLVPLIKSLLEKITNIYQSNFEIKFALADSDVLMQSMLLPSKTFGLVISATFINKLLFRLSSRMQCCTPLSEFLGLRPVESIRAYTGGSVLAIVNDIVTNPQPDFNVDRHDGVMTGALVFFLSHEVAHMTHGHLSLMASPEFEPFKAEESMPNLTSMAFEMDADASAASTLFNYFEWYIVPWAETLDRSKSSLEEILTVLFRRHITGIFMAILTTDYVSKNPVPTKYPITYARYLGIASVLEIILNKHQETLVSLIDTIRLKLVDAFVILSGDIKYLDYPLASNALTWNPGSDEPVPEYLDFIKEMTLSQFQPMLARWARLRPLLEPHLLGGKLAPASCDPI